jgi:hypothetical protein
VVGLPEVRATAATRDEALEQVRSVLRQWLASGQLVPIVLAEEPAPPPPGPPADPQALLEREFLDDLAHARQQDLEQTLRAYKAEDGRCPNTSSTPTT